VVDVNTGRYVGKKNQEETVLKTNLEAVKTIVEQLRLRNIGGLIVIDFIDMEDKASQRQVFETLGDAVKKDKARSKLLRISELGLIEMTRKRTRESLTQLLCGPCPACEGKGHVKATATVRLRSAAAHPARSGVESDARAAHRASASRRRAVPPAQRGPHPADDGSDAEQEDHREATPDLNESQYEITGVEAAA